MTLLEDLKRIARKKVQLPTYVGQFTKDLKRIEPLLDNLGVSISFSRTAHARIVTISALKESLITKRSTEEDEEECDIDL